MGDHLADPAKQYGCLSVAPPPVGLEIGQLR